MKCKLVQITILSILLFACGEDTEVIENKAFVTKSTKNNDIKEEVQKLNTILEKNPDNVDALVQRGNLELNNYDFLNAFADAARAYRLDSSRVDTRLLYASALINRPNSSEQDKRVAHEHFKNLLEQEPTNTKVMTGLANTYIFQQDIKNARFWLDRALEIDPEFIDAHILKGSIYKMLYSALQEDPESQRLANALLDSAIMTYSKITEIYPENHVMYVYLGVLLQQQNNPICIDHYLSAVQLQPDSIDYKYSLAYAYGLFDREREAMKVYREMIDQDSTYFEAYCQIGQILQFKYEEIDSALYYYSQAIDLDRYHLDAFVNTGIAYENKGDITRALQNYSKAIAIEPQFRKPTMTSAQFNEQQQMARENADKLRKKL
jgi:tetratricopeptide (TPR) repeat protein